MNIPGVTLEPETVVVLSLDGSLVYVEEIQPSFAAVVAFPEQLNQVPNRAFTPGRVGAKKISPFSKFDRAIKVEDLSPRNQLFLTEFMRLRDERGPNHIQRTPEEEAAMSVTKAGPPAKREKKERKAKETPRYMRKCTQCGEQPGHPCHGKGDGLHDFLDPGDDAPAEKPGKQPRAKKEKAPKAAKRGKPEIEGKYKWVGNDQTLEMLSAMNPKYAEGNTGRAIIVSIQQAGEEGIDVTAVQAAVVALGKKEISVERLTLAFAQLTMAKLIAPVTA